MLVTEHSAAFPNKDHEDCFVQIVVKSGGDMLNAIDKNKYFSLSLLAHSQLQVALDIYLKQSIEMNFETRHHVPYVKNANSVLLCSLKQTVELGINTVVIGHVFDAMIANEPGKPLVNYTMNFCSVDDERMPVPNSKNQNSRLKVDQPPAP